MGGRRVSNRLRLTAATVACALASLSAPGAAMADTGTYDVLVCQDTAQFDVFTAPPDTTRGWTGVTGGSSYSPGGEPAAWPTTCSHVLNSTGDYHGTGASFGDALSGTQAFTRFVPPAGATVSSLAAHMNLYVQSGSYAEAGVFTAAGRALEDNSYYLAGGGAYAEGISVAYNSAALGADGAQGVMIGGRCPASLPPGAAGICGAAGAALSAVTITISDPSDPVLSASASLDASGVATVSWSASDPQSGIGSVSVYRDGESQDFPCRYTGDTVCVADAYTKTFPYDTAGAPPSPVTQTGSRTAQLAPGQTSTFTVAARATGRTVTKTFTLTRPGELTPTPNATPTPTPTRPQATPTPKPAATPAPQTTSAKLTLHATAKPGRRLQLHGTATGCTNVTVKPPKSKTRRVAVHHHTWTLTTHRTTGTYRATCGVAARTYSARR